MEEEEARRAQEEAYRNAGGDGTEPPPTPEELMELQLRTTKFPQLDPKALAALKQLGVRDAIKALKELEAKGGGIRNPSAWICRTAQNLKEKQRARNPVPPPPQQEEESGGDQLDIVDHYGALEVAEDADEATIKKAYRKLVLKWHPDKHPEGRDEAEEKIRAINNAYENLSNATKRATYDAQRQALLRQKRGLGPDANMAMAPRQRIPREFMLQPIGYPDKFVRYLAEKARGQVIVNSRADAKNEGMSGLEQFVPFFRAAKLSLWWLPEVNNMCRIRALEARTRSSGGEKVVAGRPGGLNLGFHINIDGGPIGDSDLKLMEAGKGEKNELVNFVVVPSPLFENAFRFEAAYRRGFFLAFRAPTSLRMVPYAGGLLPAKTVIDFTLVDFQAMFKFIDVEEVMRPVIESHRGWVALETVKQDANVVAYFANILQKPMWDDDDFQSYFEGHFETWEFRVTNGVPAVRLRGVDERLGYALERVRDADEAASLIVSAGHELHRLPWKYAAAAFEALHKKGTDDVSALVQRVEAHRRLLAALGGILSQAGEEAPLSELARLSEVLRSLGDNIPADVAQRGTDACAGLGKLVLGRIAAVERGTMSADKAAIRLDDLGALLALPGVGSQSDALAKYTKPPLNEAPLASLLTAVSTAQASGAAAFAKEAAVAALKLVARDEITPSEVAGAVRCIAASGVALERAAVVLEKRAAALDTGELATTIVAFGDKGHESAELAAACRELGSRQPSLARVPAMGLLALAVAATKSSSLSGCIGAVVEAAAASLSGWTAADAIRLLLAVVKAKGEGLAASAKGALMREAAAVIGPTLGELPAAELVRLALAAGSAVGAQAGQRGTEATRLLEAVAAEAGRRLSDLPQAHLLLMTQGLAALGGRHAAMRQICSYWGEVLQDDSTATDEVSRRRKDMERGQALNAEQVAKLATVLEPLSQDLDGETADHLFAAIGARLEKGLATVTEASRTALLEQVRKGDGVGMWEVGRERLRRALEKSLAPAEGKSDKKKRSSSSSSSSDSRAKRRRSKDRRRKKSSSSSSSSSHRRKRRSRSRSRRR